MLIKIIKSIIITYFKYFLVSSIAYGVRCLLGVKLAWPSGRRKYELKLWSAGISDVI